MKKEELKDLLKKKKQLIEEKDKLEKEETEEPEEEPEEEKPELKVNPLHDEAVRWNELLIRIDFLIKEIHATNEQLLYLNKKVKELLE